MLTTTSNGEKSNKSKRTSPRPSPRRSRKEDYEVRMHEKQYLVHSKMKYTLIETDNAIKLSFNIYIIY